MADTASRPGRLGDWFREWQLPLRRFLARRQVGSRADIDDIAQEVFLRLLRHDRAELIDHPQAYIFTVAANVSKEWAIRSCKRLPHDSEWLTELVDAISPEVTLERDGLEEHVRCAVKTLPARARDILRLHFSEGLTQTSIALRLGVTRKVVRREMAHAYAVLRTTLDAELFNGRRPADAAGEP